MSLNLLQQRFIALWLIRVCRQSGSPRLPHNRCVLVCKSWGCSLDAFHNYTHNIVALGTVRGIWQAVIDLSPLYDNCACEFFVVWRGCAFVNHVDYHAWSAGLTLTASCVYYQAE